MANRSAMARTSTTAIPDAVVAAGPKPWPDRDREPWGDGDSDGEDRHGTFPDEPGDGADHGPTGDREIRARASLEEAAVAVCVQDPEAFFALIAIENRLAEIISYLPAAKRGASGDALAKLNALSRFI